jgi:spore coat protein U-like protein
MLRFKTVRMAALLVASSALALPASAAQDTDTIGVEATVVATCNITADDLSFGNYTGAAAVDAEADLSISCTNTTAYAVTLNAGTTAGATTAARKMTETGGAELNYALFSDSARTQNWGEAAGDDVDGTGSGGAQTITVYGRIAAGQLPTPGSYTDTVTATITY